HRPESVGLTVSAGNCQNSAATASSGQDHSPFLERGTCYTGKVAGDRLPPRPFWAGGLLMSCVGPYSFGNEEECRFMRRFASLGIALALAIGTLVPVANAQGTGKTLVMGFSQEP